MFNHEIIEISPELSIGERAKKSIVDIKVSIPGKDEASFKNDIHEILDREPESIEFPYTELFPETPDRAVMFTNPVATGSASEVTSFHFPGSSGKWDPERCGPQFDGYAGGALRGGVGRAVILDWTYTDKSYLPLSEDGKRGRNLEGEIADVKGMIEKAGAQKVYLSGRSYGGLVVLSSLAEAKKISTVVGVDLKLPALGSGGYIDEIIELLGETPIIITRGDTDLTTSAEAVNEIFDRAKGPKAVVTLTDKDNKHGRFDHHLRVPELKFAASAATEAFLKAILKD